MFTRCWTIALLVVAASSFECAVAWAPTRTALTRPFQECPGRSFPNQRSKRCHSSDRFSSRSSGFLIKASIADVEDSVGEAETSHSEFTRLSNVMEAGDMDNSATMEVSEAMSYEEVGQKLINGLILALSFGYAIYTIFNIDHGMTRGWTQSEVAMRIPLDNWSNYESSLVEKPVFTKTLINVVIYLLGDWLSQTVFQKKNVLDFDAWRTLRNGFIGLCFGPLVHEYYQFSDRILPVEGGSLLIRFQKIMMDQTIYLTVKCAVYISAVGLLQGDDWETVKNNVKDRIVGIIFTAWKFWPIVHLITYSVIPARHRILWVNSVDLIWNAILSTLARQEEPIEDADENSLIVVSEELSTLSEVPHIAVVSEDLTALSEIPHAAGVVLKDEDTGDVPSLREEHEVTPLLYDMKEDSMHVALVVGNSTQISLP
jgi:protein Mpv17